MIFGKLLFDFRIGENRLNTALRIVEITLNRTNADVIALLRSHLQFLHGADAVHRVENQNLCIRYIFKSL